MKILIVDDEHLALKRLERLLGEHEDINIDSFNDPLLALEASIKTRYDAAFLDISMPKLNGLELAQNILSLEPHTFIVFQTAFEEYALKAFQSGGLAYLLKPIEKQALESTLKKIRHYLSSQDTPVQKLLGKQGEHIHLVKIEDIFYIKADLDEVIVRIKDANVYVRKKIGELEKQLKDQHFFRVHRSYLVNVNKVKSMQSIEQSKLQIRFEGINESVTSSKDGAKEFREYLERTIL